MLLFSSYLAKKARLLRGSANMTYISISQDEINFMHKVKSTYKVLVEKALQGGTIDEWKDWALEMMEAGFETEHLILLAGLSPQTNPFQLDDMINKALKELSLDSMSNDEIVYGYAYYLIDQALNSKMSTKVVLGILRDLCRDRDYDNELYNFYSLSYAQQELEQAGEQYYWEGANSDNVDTIIVSEFKEWKSKYESLRVND
jgi:hypothetical protein